jgi:putative long chain acyl-CoA synthase
VNRRSLAKARRRLRASARNALELARFGRLGEDQGSHYEVIDRGPHHRVRRYPPAPGVDEIASILLVPPLMVTAEVYDVSPDVSAVAALAARGIVAYVVDFGAPEREDGGLRRTLDDHVRAVVSAIARVRAQVGRDVHLAGYSQGGMFAYQAAAYVRSEGIASIITFGSPVDVHSNLRAVRGEVTGALAELLAYGLADVAHAVGGLHQERQRVAALAGRFACRSPARISVAARDADRAA